MGKNQINNELGFINGKIKLNDYFKDCDYLFAISSRRCGCNEDKNGNKVSGYEYQVSFSIK